MPDRATISPGLCSCTIVASEGHTYRRPLKQGSTNPRSSAGDPHQREQLSSALCLAPCFRTPEDQLAADHGLRIFADKETAGFGRAQRSRKPGKGITSYLSRCDQGSCWEPHRSKGTYLIKPLSERHG